MNNFKIRILDQYWIDKDLDNITDLCSHGLIELKIDDLVISDSNDIDWTISTSGLMLLKSINNEHVTDNSIPLIQHCGQLGMIGCPRSIDWTVKHDSDKIMISDIKKYPDTDVKKVILFDGLTATIDRKKYIREVVRFSDDIKGFFRNKEREFFDDYSKDEWNSFWAEFDVLLNKHRIELKKK